MLNMKNKRIKQIIQPNLCLTFYAISLLLNDVIDIKNGAPNSFIQNGDSYGEYDSNGNLKYRVDTGHKHFIKAL